MDALKLDVKGSHLSREQISLDLTRVSGTKFSVAMINAFIAESKPHRFPAELIPAWIHVLQSSRLLDVICAELGLSPANEEARRFEDLGRHQLRTEKLKQELWERA